MGHSVLPPRLHFNCLQRDAVVDSMKEDDFLEPILSLATSVIDLHAKSLPSLQCFLRIYAHLSQLRLNPIIAI
ncbi:unnamed protein product [Protopolystoma xenopodis]|uniref:Uncharacterized protein n=1 Tax=Protopolystoma xenopodis TaxID=117903 RepID=A0A3S5FG08_9PLAT|nr:unnamed protein product [Protopolystoma xenopodis]